jgi:hypothetical protein
VLPTAVVLVRDWIHSSRSYVSRYGVFSKPTPTRSNSPFERLSLAPAVFLMLSLVISESAYAEWVAVERDYLDPGLRTVYLDPDTISREGTGVTVWQLTDYKMMQGNVGFGRFMMSPHRFFSTKTQKQLDCKRKRIRLLEYIEFLHHMGTGTASHGYVDRDAWLPIEPASVNHALWEVLCGHE